MSLSVVPCNLRDAIEFVRLHHRHSRPPAGGKFAIAVAEGSSIRAVAIAGRPVARLLQDGVTIEITRLCSDGAPNACSMLYAACKRAALAMGYKRVITYTLATENGASLKASGFRVVADVRGKSWHTPSRPRAAGDKQDKLRWEPA